MLRLASFCFLITLPLLGQAAKVDTQAIEAAIAKQLEGEHRTEARKARDTARHPAETLAFFGIEADMHVVELWPGGGWYTDILAPYLRDEGKLTVASFDPSKPPAYRGRVEKTMRDHFGAYPSVFDRVQISTLSPPERLVIAAPASADAVLTFRSNHNWLREFSLPLVYQSAFAALKPGGVLGVVQHRGKPGTTAAESRKTGYMDEALVIKMAESAGFVLEAKSDINANFADNKDHPAGVWTLPPSFRLGDQDRDKYAAIGESDRMTLRFRKPMP